MNIAVIGNSGDLDDPLIRPLHEQGYLVGKSIAKGGHVLWSGGRDGVMELASRGASESGGLVVGVLPFNRHDSLSRPNSHLDVPVFTGLDFGMRSFILVQNADLVVSLGGGAGTAIEIFVAYSSGVPVVLLRDTGGWTQKVAETFPPSSSPVYLDHRQSAPVFLLDNAFQFPAFLSDFRPGKPG
ncbi:MAG TPA: TIGR00725 family protein [Thermotogota bacterium]|nr:TIGR00725 family protein [Thermotogota bacterium]HRW92220.1 TIGR00725 family protein [Thermotogota bacterium]